MHTRSCKRPSWVTFIAHALCIFAESFLWGEWVLVDAKNTWKLRRRSWFTLYVIFYTRWIWIHTTICMMTVLTDKAARVVNQWGNCLKFVITHRIYKIWKQLSFLNAVSRPLCIHSKFWILAFQAFHFWIGNSLGWNYRYHPSNHPVESFRTLFFIKKHLFCQRIATCMKTICCIFIFYSHPVRFRTIFWLIQCLTTNNRTRWLSLQRKKYEITAKGFSL